MNHTSSLLPHTIDDPPAPTLTVGAAARSKVRGLLRGKATGPDLERARGLTLRRAIKIVLALVLVLALYYSVDARAVWAVLTDLDGWLLMAGLLLFIPQTLLSAWRWQSLVAPLCRIRLTEAVRHTLAASALNLVVPSKLGDISKSAMLPLAGRRHRAAATLRAVAEKIADVAALAAILLLGTVGCDAFMLCALLASVAAINCVLAIAAHRHSTLNTDRVAKTGWLHRLSMGANLAGSSLLLWTLHLLQIYCFLLAAGVDVSWQVAIAKVPVAIFAGLLPVSFCGFGTRDATLVWLFAGIAPAATMAAVGTLTALRYLVPGAAGIYCVGGVWRRPAEPAVVASQTV